MLLDDQTGGIAKQIEPPSLQLIGTMSNLPIIVDRAEIVLGPAARCLYGQSDWRQLDGGMVRAKTAG